MVLLNTLSSIKYHLKINLGFNFDLLLMWLLGNLKLHTWPALLFYGQAPGGQEACLIYSVAAEQSLGPGTQ